MIIGLASGYLGGWVDLVVQRLVDILQALPLLVLALVMAASLGASLRNTIIAIAIPLIPYVARVIRANTLALRELPFVEAAQAVGMSELRIAVRHVLPNTLAPLIVLGTAQLGAAILTEASLSFLGLGIPEPHPSWGRMLSESAAEYVRTAPWLVIFPGIAISLVVFGTNLLGDALARHPRSAAAQLMGERRAQESGARGRRAADGLLHPARAAQSGRRRLLHPDARRDPGGGRRIGCGKSMTALSLMRLVPDPPGRIVGGRVLLDGARSAAPRRGGDARRSAATTSP